ncbi:MAG: carboxypeptidase-like regulatory domain-containing protein [Firmicutes bacterium]|nr:carboxypeptidase-like regulatory domain-containing protein [Bacillota bacterium]
MRYMARSLAWFLMGVVAAVGGPCRAADPAPGASFEGYIYDFDTDELLSGVSVELVGPVFPSTISHTDPARGHKYAFRDVPPGSYELRASKPGYANYGPYVITLEPSDAKTHSFFMNRESPGSVRTMVYSASTGRPLNGVTLTLSGPTVPDPAGVTGGAALPGECVIQRIPAATYDLTASKPGFAAVTWKGIEVREGARTTVSLEMHPVGAGHVTGVVYDFDTGRPEPGAVVRLEAVPGVKPGGGTGGAGGHGGTGGSGAQVRDTVADQHGRYAFSGLEAGLYALTAMKTDFHTHGRVELHITQGEDRTSALYLRPVKRGSIAGTVREAGETAPVAGAVVWVVEAAGTPVHAVTDEAGWYRMDNLRPGTYLVSAEKNGYGGFGPVPVAVSEGETYYCDFEMESFLASEVSGCVHQSGSERPLSGAAVRLLGPAGEQFTAESGPDGRFRFTGEIPSGTYAVAASAPRHAAYAGRDLGIQPGERVRLTLLLRQEDDGAIRGVTYDFQTGQPVGGAAVALSGPGGLSRAQTSDQRGVYAFYGVPPGTYQISAQAPGWSDFGPARVAVSPGAGVIMNIYFRAVPEVASPDEYPEMAGCEPRDVVE